MKDITYSLCNRLQLPTEILIRLELCAHIFTISHYINSNLSIRGR